MDSCQTRLIVKKAKMTSYRAGTVFDKRCQLYIRPPMRTIYNILFIVSMIHFCGFTDICMGLAGKADYCAIIDEDGADGKSSEDGGKESPKGKCKEGKEGKEGIASHFYPEQVREVQYICYLTAHQGKIPGYIPELNSPPPEA
jgi:hypothetical protein